MRPPTAHALIAIASITLLLATRSPAQAPLYTDHKPTPQHPPVFNSLGNPGRQPSKSLIILGTPAASVSDANARFNSRAAAAVYQAANDPAPETRTGEDLGVALLGMYAYADYFPDDPTTGADRRNTADKILLKQRPGQIGSVDNGDYDMVLNIYIAILYKYYPVMPAKVSEHIINSLMSVRGPLGDHESECENCDPVAVIPETENHLLMIETARYLTNQLLYQRTHDPKFDNRRNGKGDDPQATAVWLLDHLRGYLMHDFDEYNAHNYQDMIMMALENLASYAYDGDVRLAARMVLDYISAKVAVSSNDLRRAAPFRRRNEVEHWGPPIPGFGKTLFLRSPLLLPKADYADLPNQVFEPEPQGTWYAQFAGNTLLLGGSAPGSPGHGNFGFAMLFAGTHDYRVPDSVLDLFIERAHRRFYQRFRHVHILRDKGYSEPVAELYAASPSYLITAGGHPTVYCYFGHVGPIYSGKTADFGGAMPTTFMPTVDAAGQPDDLTLESMVQLGCYSDYATNNDPTPYHLGVAPDFACGGLLYIPPKLQRDPATRTQGPWTFVNKGHRGEQRPGYYLAIYHQGSCSFLEAYDTWLHPDGLSFDQFTAAILHRYGAFRCNDVGENSYVTQSGRAIRFTITPNSDIISVDGHAPSGAFLSGDVLSDDGTGKTTIANPATGQRILLDMTDRYHPRRVGESGEVTAVSYDPRDRVHEEVWLDFHSPTPGADGDFYRPFKSLDEAQKKLAPGGTVRIVPGTVREAITFNRPMTLRSCADGAIISAK
jgi:hypothetical protein